MIGLRTKILGIAPYESMKLSMQELANSRTDFDLDVFVGDPEKCIQDVLQNLSSSYNVIVTQAGTSKDISKITAVPIVEISMSVYDMIRAIKLGGNYSEPYAVVGFPAITESAGLLCSLLQYQMDIFTVHSKDEVKDTLRQLKKNGYRMVLCDIAAGTAAKELGLNVILITAGTESIKNAFNRALELVQGCSRFQREKHFLEEVLKRGTSSKVAFTPDGEVLLSIWNKNDDLDSIPVISELRTKIKDTLAAGEHRFIKKFTGKCYEITGILVEHEALNCPVFYLSSIKTPPAPSNSGLSYTDKREMENALFSSYDYFADFSGETLDQLAESPLPILLTGETGTEKMQTAAALYIKSQLSANPLIIIDFERIDDLCWEFLLNHSKSPLCEEKRTIYFDNIDKLNQERSLQLLSILIEKDLCKRNRLLFSCVTEPGIPMAPACQRLSNALGCLTLQQVPFRNRLAELPAISSLYLGALNVELTKQIIGFEPDALALMQDYHWPLNQVQFKRVLRQLVTTANTPYIQSKDVRSILSQERSHMGADLSVSNDLFYVDINQPLEIITKDIIDRVLRETGGNQSAAAKKLKISRTTLWRYLKQVKY